MPAIARTAKGSSQSKSGTTQEVTSVQVTSGLRKVAVNAGGSGYDEGTQTLTLAGGTGTAATVSVEVVSGIVTSINSVLTPGAYTSDPSSPDTPTGGGGSGCTLDITMADGTLLVMVCDANGGGFPDTVDYGGVGSVDFIRVGAATADFSGGDSATLVSIWMAPEIPTDTQTVTVTWTTDPDERAMIVTMVNGINLADKGAGSGQDDNTDPTSGVTAATTAANELCLGAMATQGPLGDAAGTPQNSFSAGDREGTTGAGATSNRTVAELFQIVSATGSFESELATITSRETASLIVTFKFSTCLVTTDLVEIFDFDTTSGEISDDTIIGTSGQNNTDIKMEGSGSIEFQSKAVGVGGGGVDLGASIDFTGRHLYTRVRSVDAAAVEAAGGWRHRLLDDGGNFNDDYSEWIVGGSDTTGRVTTDGFLTHCHSIDEAEGRVDVGTSAPTDDDADGVGIIVNQLSASGQNTFFVDKFDYGDPGILTVTGGESDSPCATSDVTADDTTNERGVFKDIQGISYILIGVEIGDDSGSLDSFWVDLSQVWKFESQNVASDLYTVSFVGGSGTNSAIFGQEIGSGITANGVGGNTFQADRRPFNILAIDSDIIVEFYGCNFLNSGEVEGTVRLEQTNAKAVSSLFSRCAKITSISGATMRKCTVTDSVALSTEGAVDLGGTGPATDVFRDNVILNSLRGVQVTPTGTGVTTYNIPNVVYSGNTFDFLNDGTATQVSIYADTNQDDDVDLNDVNHGVGQSITGVAGTLASCQFMLNKTLSPTGNAVCKLYAITGAHGSTAIPTGAALATSQLLDVSTLDGSLTLTKFQFHDEVVISGGTDYFLSIEYTDGDATNFISVGSDSSSPTDDGNLALANTGFTWVADDTEHMIHDSYVGAIAKINILEGGDTPTVETTNNGATIVVNTVTLTVTVLDSDGAPIAGARVRIEETSGGALVSQGSTNGSGVYTDATFSYIEDTAVTTKVRLKGFKNFRTAGTVTSTGISVGVTMQTDGIVDLP